MPVGDLTCGQMARLFSGRRDHYPITDAFIENTLGRSKDGGGRTERAHMVGWFRDNATKGYGSFTRQKGNDSARTCYNRLQCPEALLWIAEAVGVDAPVVAEASSAAASVGDHRRRCAAIRAVVPWDAICERAVALMSRRRG